MQKLFRHFIFKLQTERKVQSGRTIMYPSRVRGSRAKKLMMSLALAVGQHTETSLSLLCPCALHCSSILPLNLLFVRLKCKLTKQVAGQRNTVRLLSLPVTTSKCKRERKREGESGSATIKLLIVKSRGVRLERSNNMMAASLIALHRCEYDI